MSLDFSRNDTPLDEVIDTSRPSIDNGDGSYSTERTVTVERDGTHYLVPTIVGGRELSDEDAALAWHDGKNPEVGGFRTADEAQAAATRRSAAIGKKRAQPLPDFSKSDTLAEEAPPEESSALRRYVADPAISLVKGAIGVPEAFVGLADIPTGGRVGKALEDAGFRPGAAKKTLDAMLTPEQRAANARVEKADGFVDTVSTALENPSTIGHSIIESAPSVLGGGAVARAGMKLVPRMGAVAAAAVGEGTVAGGQAAEQIRQENKSGLLEEGQASLAVGSGILTGLLGAAGGKVARSLKIGDVDTLLSGAPTADARKGIVRRVIEGAIAEGVLEELPQSAVEQIAQNLALGRPWNQGVDQASAMGMLAGAGMGAGANLRGAPPQRGANVAPAVPASDAGVIAFDKPDIAAMKAENLSASLGVKPSPVGNEIDFEGADPVARAGAIERAIAIEDARQADAGTRIPYTPEALAEAKASMMELAADPAPFGNEIEIANELRARALALSGKVELAEAREIARQADLAERIQPVPIDMASEKAANMELGDASTPGNTIDIAPFLRERVLMRANAIPVQDWMAQGDILGRRYSAETIDLAARLAQAADTDPAAAARALALVESFNPAQESADAQVQPDQVPAAPAPDANAVRGGQEARGKPEPARAAGEGPAPVEAQGVAPDFSAGDTPEVDHAAHAAATSPTNDLAEPTDAQKEAGNYAKGHVKIAGLDVSIENPAGSKRRPEWPTMKSHYGYIRRSEGADGDHVDVFVKPGTPSDFAGPVFVVDQVKANGRFDEHKTILGADSLEEARALYSENYSKGFRVGPITEMTQDHFRAWVRSPYTKRAVKSLSKSEWKAVTAGETAKPRANVDEAAAPVHNGGSSSDKPRHQETPAPAGVSTSKQPPDREQLKKYAERLVAGSRVRTVDLVGSATRAAAPNDVDLLYDLGPGLKDEAAVEAALEGIEGLDLDGYDTFVKSGERYFHVSSGAGRGVVANDDYGRKQAGLPKVRLAGAAEGNLKDFGDKIGGARKDRWRDRGLSTEDLAEMSGGEQAQYTTKDNVWPKVDYAARIAGGMEPKAAALLKIVRDRMAAKPRKDTPEGRKRYVEAMSHIRDRAAEAKTVDDVRALAQRLQVAGYAERQLPENRERLERLFSLYKGRTSPFSIDWLDQRRADAMLAEGWPTPKARTEADKAEGPKVPVRPHLDKLERTGEDVRAGRNITSQQFTEAFGFRGLEFGNWAANDERQRILNMAFEALHDLAGVLGVPPKAMSLNGTLGLALAARGGGNFAAHYEPGKLVINMTKLRGAGSLAHEWGHALDHYFGELDREDAYRGHPRGASGWYDTRVDVRDEKRLPNLRPEMVEGFNGVMRALFQKTVTKAQLVRDAELQLENTEARRARATDRYMQETLDRALTAQRQALEEIKRTMGEDERASTGGRSSYKTEAIKLSGKSGEGGYWARPTEMFARAFEAYAYDNIHADDRASDYLVHGVEPGRYATGYRGNPYPTGVEREAIAEAFDKLFATAKKKETARGVAMYRKGTAAEGMEAGDVRKAIARAVAGARVPVSVVQSVEDLPFTVDNDARGAYDEGRVWLVADNIATPVEAEITLARHEFVHAGYDLLYGGDRAARERALKDLQSKNPKLREIATGWRIGNEASFIKEALDAGLTQKEAEAEAVLRSMEEAVAYFSESVEPGQAPLNGWKTFIAVIQKALRDRGFHLLADLLNRSPEEAIAELLRAVQAPAPAKMREASPELQPALARRIFRGFRTVNDFIVPETPEYEGDMTGNLAVVPKEIAAAHPRIEAWPVRITEGVARGEHKGYGLEHMRAEAELDRGRAPRRHTPDDLAENFVRDVAEIARAPVRAYYDEKTDRPVLQGKGNYGIVLEPRGQGENRFYSVLTMFKPKDPNWWGRPVWTGRVTPASEPPKSVASGPSPGHESRQPGRQPLEVQTERFQFTPPTGKLPPKAARSSVDPGALDFPGGGKSPVSSVQDPAKLTPKPGQSPPNLPPISTGSAQGGAPAPHTWNAGGLGFMDKLVYELQDKHVDTKKVLRAIDAAKGTITDATDPYLQEELYHGRAAKATDDFLEMELKPLIRDMATRGVKIADFEEWLHARHAAERNAQIARINPQLPDGGSGMKNADAAAVLARARTTGMATAYQALAARVDAITAATRAEMVRYGLEAPSAVAAWGQAYKHYVPLQREDMEGGMGTGQGFSVRGNATKRATGSTLAVVDILANIALQRERVIARGEKARVGRALLGLAQANPNPDFWRVDVPPKITRVDDRTGLVTSQVDPLYKSRENVMVVPVPDAAGNIVDHAIVFNEHDERARRMAAAMKNLDMDELGAVLGTAAKFTRWFASVNTQWNPVFGVVNFTRDAQGAMLNLTSTPLAGKQADVAVNAVRALRGIYSDLRATRSGRQASSPWSQLWDEFQGHGGRTGYRDVFATSADRAKALEDELDKGNTKKAVEHVLGWLSDYNDTMENSFRLAAYKVAIDNGISKERAASLAKNLTVNFNRKGARTTQAAALYAFFNANVQGTARTIETLTGPAGAKIIAGGVLAGVIQALALAAAGMDDDEPPDWIKEKAFIIPLGGKKYLSIPMAQGFLVLPNLGRLGAEYVMSGFKGAGKKATEFLKIVLDASVPVGASSTVLQMISPTVIDPIAALAENKDWTGKPIAREDFNKLHPTPGHTRAKNTASEFSKVVSKAINAASGGTAHKPGTFSYTPDQIDYLIGQVTGGVGREAMKFEQAASAIVTGEKLPPHKIPLVGRFYGDSAESSTQASRFYSNLEEINRHRAEVKGRAKAGEPLGDYLRENPEARLAERALGAERQISALRKQKTKLLEQGAGKERVQAIEDEMNRRMTTFNEAVKSAKAAAQ